jgi:hypothetical protein
MSSPGDEEVTTNPQAPRQKYFADVAFPLKNFTAQAKPNDRHKYFLKHGTSTNRPEEVFEKKQEGEDRGYGRLAHMHVLRCTS